MRGHCPGLHMRSGPFHNALCSPEWPRTSNGTITKLSSRLVTQNEVIPGE
jgi:hypothetical protein